MNCQRIGSPRVKEKLGSGNNINSQLTHTAIGLIRYQGTGLVGVRVAVGYWPYTAKSNEETNTFFGNSYPHFFIFVQVPKYVLTLSRYSIHTFSNLLHFSWYNIICLLWSTLIHTINILLIPYRLLSIQREPIVINVSLYYVELLQRAFCLFSVFVEACSHDFEEYLYDNRDSSPSPSRTIVSPNYPWVCTRPLPLPTKTFLSWVKFLLHEIKTIILHEVRLNRATWMILHSLIFCNSFHEQLF